VFKENANLDMHEHGMDVALVCYDPIAKTLEFCGAGRPLYLRTQDGGLQRIAGNKRSIGSKRMRNQAFEKETIFIHQSAWVYLQSDGFTDQFGGEENKKIHRKNYESFIQELGHNNGDQQYQAFRNFHAVWKNDQEQVDDILVMGVKVE
jgi:serine phosphatase RsbU (regulator of sigma subunit)